MTKDNPAKQNAAAMDLGSMQACYTLITTPGRLHDTWLFRFAIVVIAYVTVACCGWLFKSSTSPLLDAIPIALGVVLGFLVLHVLDWNNSKIIK